MTRTVQQCRAQGCQDLILIPGEFGYRCRYSGESPRFTPDCKHPGLHPVHRGELKPSAKNCEGCYKLMWEDLSPPAISRRRRVCIWFDPPRIPGNIPECPLRDIVEIEREMLGAD